MLRRSKDAVDLDVRLWFLARLIRMRPMMFAAPLMSKSSLFIPAAI
jgi:hypothetical protein